MSAAGKGVGTAACCECIFVTLGVACYFRQKRLRKPVD